MYIDFDTYKAKGGTFSETDFGIYESLAEAEIRRIIGDTLPPESTLINCMMLLLNAYQQNDSPSEESRVLSMSNDEYSVTYKATESGNPLDLALSRVRLLLADAKILSNVRAVRVFE